MRSASRKRVRLYTRSEFESLAFRVTKEKRNKAKFWCHRCGLLGYRNPVDAQAKAKEQNKTAFPCPSEEGWHYS